MGRWIFALLFSVTLAAASDQRGPRMLEGRQAPETQGKRGQIRVDVDLALVPVTVVDPMGRAVLGLRPENFRLYDEKQPREIVSFASQDAPVAVGIVFDASGSMKEKQKAAREAVAEFLKQLNPEDQIFLVAVSDRPERITDFTNDEREILDAVMFSRPGGRTALIDGIYLSLNQLRKAQNPRRALVVISDGADNSSRYNMGELMSLAMESDAQIYTVGIYGAPGSAEEAEGPYVMEELAQKTGGRTFEVRNSTDLVDAMSRVGATLHNQYVIGYYPPHEAPAGKYRHIRVELQVPAGLPELRVHARRGYYTPE